MRKDITDYKNLPVILCGMHRSGTSLLSRVLSELDVFMGEDLEINHESLSFLHLNDELLKYAHSFWDQVEGAYHFFNNKKAVNQAAEIARNQFMGKKFNKKFFGSNKGELWGWKDPRNTITFPIWLRVFREAKIIFVYRNAVDSVASIVRREYNQNLDITVPAYSSRCLNHKAAFGIWEDYNNFFLRHKEVIPQNNLLEIKYEDFLNNPETHVSQLASFLGFEDSSIKRERVASMINRDRSLPFYSDSYLVDFYNSIKDSELMIRLGYDNLL